MTSDKPGSASDGNDEPSAIRKLFDPEHRAELQKGPVSPDRAALAQYLARLRYERGHHSAAPLSSPEVSNLDCGEVLLHLYSANRLGARFTVSGLCIACGASAATLRCLRVLVDIGLVVRIADPSSASRTYVDMTDISISIMDDLYLGRICDR